MINVVFVDWYNSDADEFLFEDPEDVLGTVDTAIDLIHRCVDMELYEDGCILAEQLAAIEVQDEGEYNEYVGNVLDIRELNVQGLLTCDFEQLCKDSLYLAYKGNEMEYRSEEIFMTMMNLRCWHLSLEDLMQNGQEELDGFEEFLDLWVEYLASQEERHVEGLIQEAQSLMNNEEKELENAKLYARQYPSLYKQYLKKHEKADDDQKFFEIGRASCRERVSA